MCPECDSKAFVTCSFEKCGPKNRGRKKHEPKEPYCDEPGYIDMSETKNILRHSSRVASPTDEEDLKDNKMEEGNQDAAGMEMD
ncbi:hypothetical protein FQN51_002689 [Onygenales sp. PD_10]|nr:hypothetical protein FQN51_002689 [Onygenales sp. PD_10]